MRIIAAAAARSFKPTECMIQMSRASYDGRSTNHAVIFCVSQAFVLLLGGRRSWGLAAHPRCFTLNAWVPHDPVVSRNFTDRVAQSERDQADRLGAGMQPAEVTRQ
jgi:hypothetical protein